MRKRRLPVIFWEHVYKFIYETPILIRPFVSIGGYKFRNLYSDSDNIKDKSGIYVVLCYPNMFRFKVIDIGESSSVRTRIKTHDRKKCWKQHCWGTIKYAVRYTPHMQEAGRKGIEKILREKCNPACGKQQAVWHDIEVKEVNPITLLYVTKRR